MRKDSPGARSIGDATAATGHARRVSAAGRSESQLVAPIDRSPQAAWYGRAAPSFSCLLLALRCSRG
jgi:hypothetical protein